MHHSIRSLFSAYRRYGVLDNKEFLYIILTSIVFGFIFGFRKWGDSAGNYDPLQGISNWVFYSIFSFLGIFIMQVGIRMSAIEKGYKPTYVPWHSGWISNLFIAFLTNGFAIFLSPGGFELRRIPGMQMGKQFQGVVYADRSTAVFWGFFAISIYSALVKLIFGEFLNAEVFAVEMVLVAYIIALWSLFPIDIPLKIFMKNIPISNGSSLFHGGWSKAVGAITYLVLSFVFLFIFSGLVSIILAGLFAAIAYVVFFLFADPQKQVYASPIKPNR